MDWIEIEDLFYFYLVVLGDVVFVKFGGVFGIMSVDLLLFGFFWGFMIIGISGVKCIMLDRVKYFRIIIDFNNKDIIWFRRLGDR